MAISIVNISTFIFTKFVIIFLSSQTHVCVILNDRTLIMPATSATRIANLFLAKTLNM